MKQFQIPTILNGNKTTFIFGVGNPDQTHHPLHFQLDYLQKIGGEINDEFKNAVSKVHKISIEYIIPLDALFYYVCRISGGIDSKTMLQSEYDLNQVLMDPINPVQQ